MVSEILFDFQKPEWNSPTQETAVGGVSVDWERRVGEGTESWRVCGDHIGLGDWFLGESLTEVCSLKSGIFVLSFPASLELGS
jgi:hypothetical protein